jgi:hypothetical protein
MSHCFYMLIKTSGELVTYHGCMERSGILPLSWISPVNAFFKIARGEYAT